MIDEYHLLKRVQGVLLNNQPIRSLTLSDKESKIIKSYGFLTLKPTLYVCNISEEDLINQTINQHVQSVYDLALKQQSNAIMISAKIEAELSELDKEDKTMYLEELGLEKTGLDHLIAKSYELLGLQTFFTAGKKEVRAWTFYKNMKAPQCAGVIHSDFERGFIRAETIAYDDLLLYENMIKAKEAGKVRSEGKEYIVHDGDIILFRFNV